jgi:hypothetical protein
MGVNMFKNYLNRSNAEFDPIGDPLGGDPKFSRIRKFNDPVTAAIGASAGASLLGSAVSGNAAKSAAQTQADAATQAAQLQQQTALAGIPILQGAYGQGTQDVNNLYNAQLGNQSNLYQQQYNNLQPYENAGGAAASQLQSLIPQLSNTFNNADLNSQLAPNYQWQLQQGLGATNQAMNVAGGGSNMVNAADIFAQNYAGNAYQNAFNNYQTQQNNIYNRLSGIANIGLTGTGQNIQAGNQYSNALTSLTNNTSSNLANLATGLGNNTVGLTTGAAQAGASGITGTANANAAGQIGAANSLSSGLSNAGNNYLLSQLLAAKNPASNAQPFPISNDGLISGTSLGQ